MIKKLLDRLTNNTFTIMNKKTEIISFRFNKVGMMK